jgi:hypothetical protein
LGLHSHKKSCKGNDCVIYSEIRVSKRHDCIGRSSLIHELIHFFQFHIEGTQDSDHTSELYWVQGCNKYSGDKKKDCIDNTIVKQSNMYLCREFCNCK